ncbi:hypothetical protein GpartN1_g5240.t1 [Galdieria partita]|uniref:Uncharacterized protein n=1 Tax=Galdieria partita TaxID=83374 RepID=A0A9C7URV5_9RHOD|nr:hypothetical protein GpartN1_g961.t1 [Galdieria partita]GJQ13449.1 hypothetical protein GpartN1_g5240.t1 [Galdieria partita]
MPKRTETATRQNANELKQDTKQISQEDLGLIDGSSGNERRQRKRRPSSHEKSEKGLRSFAIRVRKKVEEKKRTTYNQVADELVKEVLDPTISDPTDRFYNEKNVRRRVYDALNVLMAMGMIEKQKKDILWRGVSFDSSEFLKELEEKLKSKNEELRQKRQKLEELEAQRRAVEAMLTRNASSSIGEVHPESCIHLPFIIVSTSTDTSIDVEMEENAEEVLFTFNRPFEIYDDQVILQGVFRSANFNDRIDGPTHLSLSEKQPDSSTSNQLDEQMNQPTQHSSFSNILSKNFVDNNMFNSHLIYLTDDT